MSNQQFLAAIVELQEFIATNPGQTHLNFHKPNMVEFKACNIVFQ
jgi:hypothetical protein